MELRDRLNQNRNSIQIADIFLQYDFKKVYIPYCSNYPKSIEVLRKMRSSPEFSNYLKVYFLFTKKESPDSMRLDLSDLLIQPIQRIPRYIIMLKVH